MVGVVLPVFRCGAHYDGYSPTQQQIRNQIGAPARPYSIALGVSIFTASQGTDWEYGPGEQQQDMAISAQMSSVMDGVPSISIVNKGAHAVLVTGFEWTETVSGPRADIIHYHDPDAPPYQYDTAKSWKKYIFTAYQSKHVIILGHHSYQAIGENAYYDFLEADGYYYGGPRPYLPL